ncbi:MAG TPA: hypothetical protein PLT86_08520, partial [Candidatus Latescibacteria bacterium]|nr:hypothetical protein [Candidatus Latescibacterota bacterium]
GGSPLDDRWGSSGWTSADSQNAAWTRQSGSLQTGGCVWGRRAAVSEWWTRSGRCIEEPGAQVARVWIPASASRSTERAE